MGASRPAAIMPASLTRVQRLVHSATGFFGQCKQTVRKKDKLL
jgi:hypothetical protein